MELLTDRLICSKGFRNVHCQLSNSAPVVGQVSRASACILAIWMRSYMTDNDLIRKETARMNTLVRFEHYAQARRQAAVVWRLLPSCATEDQEWVRASLRECEARAGVGASATRLLLAFLVIGAGSLATWWLSAFASRELGVSFLLPLLLGLSGIATVLIWLGLIPMHQILRPEDSESYQASQGNGPWWLWLWVSSR
ncbi:hypothetical protein DYH09_27855 [bacterium CPR1]|nr:hypothetical protein [bacterium CPR1]